MLRAAKTAVQALIADISPWILQGMMSLRTRYLKAGVLRWVAGAEVCASAYYFIGSVVHDDGPIGSEWTRTALLEESFVCLVIVSYYTGSNLMEQGGLRVACTSREYYMEYH